MNRLFLSRHLLPSTLTGLLLLLVVNLYAQGPSDCKYAYDSVYACDVGCSMSPRTCVPYCHLVQANCSTNKENILTPTTSQATKQVDPGTGQLIGATDTHQCAEIWSCIPVELKLSQCVINGSTSSCSAGQAPQTCYVCQRGPKDPPCTVSVDTLQGCQLGG